MADNRDYTNNLELVLPKQSDQYNVDDFNNNMNKIDQFAGQVPVRALTADTLTVARKINGVNFKGDSDIITGLGLHNATVTYNQSNLAYKVVDDEVVVKRCLNNNTVGDNFDDDTKWEKVEMGGNSRNIGEIVASTIPLTDAGLHLLDGALLQGSGSYADFVTYIAGLRTNYSSLFTTESAWQSSVSNYGVCGKFVYNSTNNTLRLPKYNSKIYTGGGTTSVVGNGSDINFLQSGTTNSYAVLRTASTQSAGGFVPAGLFNDTDWPDYNSNWQLSKEPANSGIIADLANITTSLDGYYYIVVATSTKTDIEVDIDEIATDLNGKMDKDGTNAVNSVKFADGQWVVQETELSTATAVGTYNINLASVLPNDNYKYECIFKYVIVREGSDNSNSYYNAGVTVNNMNVEFATDCVQGGTSSGDVVRNGGVYTMPIGTDRSMFIVITSTNLKQSYTKLVAYRRIGTNQ